MHPIFNLEEFFLNITEHDGESKEEEEETESPEYARLSFKEQFKIPSQAKSVATKVQNISH